MTNTFVPEHGKRTTLRDVAREAGVSIKTVSRVVNEEPLVNEATAARVAEAVKRLGYRPNELARSLKGQRSRTIGLVIDDVSNPFMATCAQAIEAVAREHGHALVLCDSHANLREESDYVGLLTQRQVDGLLIVPARGHDSHLKAEQEAGLPVVAFDRPAEGVSADTVLVENREGTREATEHLIEHGHERIAFVGDVRHFYTARKRLEGYKEALEAARLQPLHALDAHTIEQGEVAAKGFLDAPDPPTALFAANILTTLGALRAIEDLGLRIPEDVAVIGFDDFELAHVLRPRFTLVRQPAAELGRRAAQLLFDRLDSGDHPEPRRLVLPTELVVRGAGTSAQAATLWGSNVIITLTLLSTINAIGPGPIMWMYAGFNVLAFLFVLRYFPELAGRSLEDIETSLREGAFRPGGVPIRDEGTEEAAT